MRYEAINKKMSLCSNVPTWTKEIPWFLKTQKMCNKAVCMERYSLAFVPDHFKTEGMCLGAVRKNPYTQ